LQAVAPNPPPGNIAVSPLVICPVECHYSIFHMHYKHSLCQPYDPFGHHPEIYRQVFLPARTTIALRPVHIAQDLPLINKWFNLQFADVKNPSHDPFQYDEDYYTTLLTGANSQPLMGMIDRSTAFQADIYQAILGPDNLLEAGHFSRHDFIMQLLLSPDAMQNLPLTMYSLLACLDCFFRYEEVGRITWMTHTKDRNFRFIATLAELDELSCGDELQSFFMISKDRFRQVQFGLPLYPEQQSVAMGC
jgi:Acetyltransferase (GNAT) domain